MSGRQWKQLRFSADMALRKLMEDERLLNTENKLRVDGREVVGGEGKMGHGH